MKQINLHRITVLVTAAVYIAVLAATIVAFRPSDFPIPTLQTAFNGEWTGRVETYLTEHIGFHDELFRVKSRADLLLGEKMIQGVYVTDNMLLEKLVTEEVQTPEDSAAPVNDFYEKAAMPTYLILVPSASEVYKTTLPANAVNADQKNRIQAIYAATAAGVRCVDAYNVLSSRKNNYIYYRTDSHWTSYGCYCVYQAAIQKMGVSAVPYENYVISHLSTEYRGDLYARTLYDGVKADVLDRYRKEDGVKIQQVTAYYGDGTIEDRGKNLYEEAALDTENMYRFYLGNPCEKLVVQTNLENGRKLLLYKDDFADCMIPFLAEHYSEICIVDLTRMRSAYLSAADPSDYTQALFLCSMENWDKIWK